MHTVRPFPIAHRAHSHIWWIQWCGVCSVHCMWCAFDRYMCLYERRRHAFPQMQLTACDLLSHLCKQTAFAWFGRWLMVYGDTSIMLLLAICFWTGNIETAINIMYRPESIEVALNQYLDSKCISFFFSFGFFFFSHSIEIWIFWFTILNRRQWWYVLCN